MSQSSDPPYSRRRFFGLGLKGLAYAAPAIVAVAVPALAPDEAEGAAAKKGAAPKMGMMMGMMMKMPMMPAMK